MVKSLISLPDLPDSFGLREVNADFDCYCRFGLVEMSCVLVIEISSMIGVVKVLV